MVASKELHLVAERGTLVLVSDERDWTTVALAGKQEDKSLGAADIKYLTEHLEAFLRQPPRELRWVLTLSETYNSFYGLAVEDGAVLRIQDRDAQFFDEVRLSGQEREKWLNELEAVCPACK